MKYSILYALFFTVILASCKDNTPTTRFVAVDSDLSGLKFNNALTENDSINIIDNEFVYNGAGVALGDLNGDGLDDIFFAGNQVDNKLFINLGGLKFKDISKEAEIEKTDSLFWSSGISLVDLNLDGKLDIYVCNTFYKDSLKRKNLLYINQGNDESGIPFFKEMAEEYNIADDTYSSHAQFFDFDNDGDLDLFIGVNRIEGINPNEFSPLNDDGTSQSKDRLYRNDWNDSLKRPVFVNVSDSAGIRYHGYSHSTLINDFNNDGWMDIYVANDFLSNDLVYMNNQDGTFTNKAGDLFKHFSFSSMGSDIADVDNDGKLDLYTTEMQPYYNKRKKLFQGPSNYQKEIFTKKYEYEQQYTRNTLQMNKGINPETKVPIYAELGMYAGIQETDWSWAPLFADYDNDGWQDLYITNGFPKDVTDRDFGDFRATASRLVSKEVLIAAIPEIKIPNFMYKNNGDLTFTDVTKDWGLNFRTFSNGAAYGDLDMDGDLDIIVNNINDNALLLENKTSQIDEGNHYLRVKLKGKTGNKEAIGSVAEIYVNGKKQRQSLLSGRGYLSKPESIIHFGIGNEKKIDSLKITWPGGATQKLTKITIDTLLNVSYSENTSFPLKNVDLPNDGLFEEVANQRNLMYLARDIDFIDFNFQTTIPHKFSQYGPSIAVGDINADGLEDMFISGSRSYPEMWFTQKEDGTFVQQEANYKNDEQRLEEDAGTLLFDVDGDQDLDLYIARGCAQYPSGHEYYRDVLLINDGHGNFKKTENALPDNRSNSSAIKAADFDRDGDLDLFVGSRVLPFSYPKADRSFILRNDSKPGNPKFVDVTEEVSDELMFPGLISDALWTDFNNDFWPDLILAAEWMPLRFFKNVNGKLIEVTEYSGLSNQTGWWNSLAAADLDNDGDTDYVAGNYGSNINFKGTPEEPLRIYAKDLDQNGTVDPLLSYYLRDSVGVRKEYLYHPWQDVTKQYVGIRKKFNSFGDFGESTLPEMFSDGLLNDALTYSMNHMQTSWVENLGEGKFKLHALPIEAQVAPVFGVLPAHINEDSFMDLLLVGNDFGMEVQQGPADALIGVALKNDGQGNFKEISLEKSNFFVPGNAKGLVNLITSDQESLIIATQNNDSIKVYKQRQKNWKNIVEPKPNEVKAKIVYANGSNSIHEFYWGSTFHSQSSRRLKIIGDAKEISFYDNFGKQTRTITF
ncbi:VCBS repeat-containing protein [Maribacter algicola]|uniref:VCBS repeat-containing protein n=1 Tax=Meishania litoralis TaxID=3434685 RepID=A0ACC7LTU5_9FLAO